MSAKYTILLVALAAAAPAFGQSLFSGSDAVSGSIADGHATYLQSCAVCHGPQLEGSPFGPTLIGPTFIGKWRGKLSGELLQQMRETMPPRGTGTVKPEAFPDLLAFLVRANVAGVPAPAAAVTAPAAAVTAPAVANARVVATAPAPAQPLTPAQQRTLAALRPVTESLLRSPPEGSWLMWRRTFDTAGFSPLRQINRDNVRQLERAWSLRLGPSGNEITPLVHDGVLFVYSGSALHAVEAASGKPLWKFEYRAGGNGNATVAQQYGGGRNSRVRSVALHGNALFMPTPDGHLVAVDTRTGKLLWDRAINAGAGNTGLQLSSGPLVARGMVIIGASLGLNNKGGCFIVALDATSGEERWRFNTVARPGMPGGDSWNGAPVEERFGGGVWTTGSYDPDLNLVYFGVGNTYNTATLLVPRPGAAGVTANDGLYTNSTLALRPETGELVWHHQHHRRDVWDQDWAFEQTLVTLGTGPTARRAVVTGGKTGVFEAMDAATGRILFAHDTGLTNLFLGVDAQTGAKRINPELEPVAGKTLLLCPGNMGSRNWPATSLDPSTGTLYVPMVESCADFTWEPRGSAATLAGGSDIRFSPRFRPESDGNFGRVMAIDLNTQKVRWTHRQRMPLAGSLLGTAGGLVFMADLGRKFSAFDQESGRVLWQTQLPAAAESTSITYAVDGRQYIAVVSGEGSHLGVNNRRLVPELDDPKTDLELIVFALPGK